MGGDLGASRQRSGTLLSERDFDDRYRNIGRLLITCPDRPGIVASVSRFLFENGANIVESQQYSTDPFGGTFFLRVEVHLDDLAERFADLEERFAPLSDEFSMRWRMARAGLLKRVAIFVTKADHALQELMWRVHSRELNADIHSFLPAFAGPDPYQAAAERGVKLIGATAHYVTVELDAGPIIEQDILRVDHRRNAGDLRRLGRHVERSVLARAVGWHLDDRVIVHQNKTIVFA